jgi:hypothetical protein
VTRDELQRRHLARGPDILSRRARRASAPRSLPPMHTGREPTDRKAKAGAQHRELDGLDRVERESLIRAGGTQRRSLHI